MPRSLEHVRDDEDGPPSKRLRVEPPTDTPDQRESIGQPTDTPEAADTGQTDPENEPDRSTPGQHHASAEETMAQTAQGDWLSSRDSIECTRDASLPVSNPSDSQDPLGGFFGRFQNSNNSDNNTETTISSFGIQAAAVDSSSILHGDSLLSGADGSNTAGSQQRPVLGPGLERCQPEGVSRNGLETSCDTTSTRESPVRVIHELSACPDRDTSQDATRDRSSLSSGLSACPDRDTSQDATRDKSSMSSGLSADQCSRSSLAVCELLSGPAAAGACQGAAAAWHSSDSELSDSDIEEEAAGDAPFVHWSPTFSPEQTMHTHPLLNWQNVVCNRLYRAVSKGQLEVVRQLLKDGEDPNQAFYYDGRSDYSALHRAVLMFKPEMVNVLLEAGCLPDKRDLKGCTPFMLAVTTAQYDVATMLLHAGADVNATNRDSRTALMETYEEEGLDLLLQANAQVNLPDVFGSTALLDACTRGSLPVVMKLLKAGADVNVVDREGQTALMCAANCCAGDIAKELLANGADIHAGNFRGITALQHAAAVPRGHVMMEALLDAGCDADQRDCISHTPLIYAIEMGRAMNVRTLVLANAQVEYRFPMFGLEFTPFQLTLLQVHELLKGVTSEGERLTFGEMSKVGCLLSILQLLVVGGAKVSARTGKIREQLATIRTSLTSLASMLAEDTLQTGQDKPEDVAIQKAFLTNVPHYHDIIDLLSFTLHTPRSLAELSRLKVRSFLRPALRQKLHQLKLPETVQNYVLLNELNKIEVSNL